MVGIVGGIGQHGRTQIVTALPAATGRDVPHRTVTRFVRDVGGCARLLTAPAANYLVIARTHPDAAILLRTVSELV